jgi:hypothetical protein
MKTTSSSFLLDLSNLAWCFKEQNSQSLRSTKRGNTLKNRRKGEQLREYCDCNQVAAEKGLVKDSFPTKGNWPRVRDDYRRRISDTVLYVVFVKTNEIHRRN